MQIKFKSRNDKQIEAASYWLDQTTEQLLYGGAKGGGKSYLGCSLIFGDALIYPNTHYFIARKDLTDLRKYTIPSIHEVLRNWGLDATKYASYNGQDNCFNLYNKSKVFLIACKFEPSDPMYERFGSMQMTRGWIEEAGEVEEAAKSNLWLSVGRWKNDEYKLKKKLLMTANPKKGFLKRDFVEPWKQMGLLSDKKFVRALATDNPYLPSDYLKSLEEERDVVRRQRLWLGDWDYDEEKDSMIAYEALSDAFSNALVKDGQHYLVVDVARFGDDHTVYGFWDDLELVRIERHHGNDTEKTKQQIRDYALIHRIPYSNILVDETGGLGGSIIDGLKGVRGFVSSSGALISRHEAEIRIRKIDNPLVPRRVYLNLKAQAGAKTAELINEHKISFAVEKYRDMIIEDLSGLLRYRAPDSDGKIALKDKEEVKRELGRSPDVGDMIVMRSWFELMKGATKEDPMDANVRREQQFQFSINKVNQKLNSTR